MVFVAFIIGAFNLSACEIDFKIIDGEKDKYEKGDVLVIKVIVVYTHRNCPEGIEATVMKTEGIKVVKATRWSEKAVGTYERKFKIQITGDKKDMSISAIRTCDKEGGFGALVLSAK